MCKLMQSMAVFQTRTSLTGLTNEWPCAIQAKCQTEERERENKEKNKTQLNWLALLNSDQLKNTFYQTLTSASGYIRKQKKQMPTFVLSISLVAFLIRLNNSWALCVFSLAVWVSDRLESFMQTVKDDTLWVSIVRAS